MVRGASYTPYLRFLSHFMWESVITFYEKGSGKGARHLWTSKAMTIGALSYIAVQCYEHIQSRQSPYRFRPMECVATRTRRFHLLHSLAFLCMVPPSSLEAGPSGDILKLRPGPFSDVFHALLSEQDSVLASVGVLLARTPGHGLGSDAVLEEAED